jgi:hypothetical protein
LELSFDLEEDATLSVRAVIMKLFADDPGVEIAEGDDRRAVLGVLLITDRTVKDAIDRVLAASVRD